MSRPSVTGEQILDAIGGLSDLIRRQSQRHDQCCQRPGHEDVYQASRDGNLWSTNACNDTSRYGDGMAAVEPLNGTSAKLTPLQSQGVESLLAWEPLVAFQPASSTFGSTDVSQIPNSQLPNIDYAELSRLEEKYIVAVHLKNPFLDLADLHQKILQTAENGLDWSTRTCLVTLVCAIGALNQRYQDPANISVTSPSPGVVRSSVGYESEAELSMQYWGIAARRIGFAISQNNIEAVQCLCLAG